MPLQSGLDAEMWGQTNTNLDMSGTNNLIDCVCVVVVSADSSSLLSSVASSTFQAVDNILQTTLPAMHTQVYKTTSASMAHISCAKCINQYAIYLYCVLSRRNFDFFLFVDFFRFRVPPHTENRENGVFLRKNEKI